MTVIFIYWGGQYAGVKDAVASAVARSGCPVITVSDQPAFPGVRHHPIAEFAAVEPWRETMRQRGCVAESIARWLVLYDFMLRYGDVTFPVFCADWDVLIMRDLKNIYAPFLQCDYTISRVDTCDSAAYGVNRLEPLEAVCKLIETGFGVRAPSCHHIGDMAAWEMNTAAFQWNKGNLAEVHNDSVFDHSLPDPMGQFEMDGDGKRIVWGDGGYPYFVRSVDKKFIAANTFHCWGAFKTRTAELREKAGIPALC